MCLKVLFKKNNYNTYKKRVTVHMTSRIRNASHIEKFNTTSFNIIKRFQIRSIKFKEKNVSEYIKKHTKSLCYVTNPSRNIPNSGFTEMSIKKIYRIRVSQKCLSRNILKSIKINTFAAVTLLPGIFDFKKKF